MHFTYEDIADEDLCQGDIVLKNEEIKKILSEVHPHYEQKEDYTHFMVLTQSCDLVRRKHGVCKSRYITLAAIRPVSVVIEKEFGSTRPAFDRKYDLASKASRSKLDDMLRKLYNNNLEEYFFLQAQNEKGIDENSAVFLRLSIALRAAQHYDAIIRSRVIGLTPEFRAKLGWMVGNVYSRVGTEDFSSKYPDLLKDQIKSEADQYIWEDGQKLERLRKICTDDSMSKEDVLKTLDEIQVEKKSERVLEVICEVLRSKGLDVSEDVKRQLLNLPDVQSIR